MTAEESQIQQPQSGQSSTLRKKKFLLQKFLGRHIQNFHKQLLLNRRRAQQRHRRRQAMLRDFYVEQLMTLETSFLEFLLPVPGIHAVRESRCTDNNKKDSSDEADTEDTTPILLQPGFYENAIKNYSATKWWNTFRMTKNTFFWLCGQLHSVLQSSDASAISVEKHLAIALYTFATGDDYQTVAALFNIEQKLVCALLRRFAEALLENLGACLLTMPKSEQDFKEIRMGFKRASNMPALVAGVLGICEIPVRPFKENSAFANEMDGCTSIILQTLIDDRKLFRKVRVQNKRPNIYLEAPNEIIKIGTFILNGRNLNCVVVTPATYPLRPWLMHEYEEPQTPAEYEFNKVMSKLIAIQEQALLRLFSRWKILQRKYDLEPRTMEPIATACCALHNLLEEAEEKFSEGWVEGFELSNLPQNIQHNFSKSADNTDEALETRDFLANYINSITIKC